MLKVGKTLRVLPVHLINPRANDERSVYVGEELESLITTLGGQIVDRIIQKRENPDRATFVGKGKIQEIADKVKEKNVDVIVLNTTAKPGQVHALKTILQKTNPAIEVWDRVDLILQIFDLHAVTTEAKLQIELARMRYMGPRIYGMGAVLSRQGGGIGTSGIGETNTELMKRHWRSGIKKITTELNKLSKDKEERIKRRQRDGYKTVSIVGYTNAGKSSLFNYLTGKNALVGNVLFATLDSATGEAYLPKVSQTILVTDTIGFMRNLPPHLIQAFKSTLIESINADVVLHLIDASDPEIDEKIIVTEGIIKDLGIDSSRVIYIFNKIDKISNEDLGKLKERYKTDSSMFISVKERMDAHLILEKVSDKLKALSTGQKI